MKISENVFLFFEDDGQEKYTFYSNDAELQKWCESVKRKRIKKNEIKFVVDAAKKCGQNRPKVQMQSAERSNPASRLKQSKLIDPATIIRSDTKDFVSALNYYCQKSGQKFPEYKNAGTIQSDGNSWTTIKLIDSEGRIKSASAPTKQEAKQKVTLAYCRDILGIKGLSDKEIKVAKAKEIMREQEIKKIETAISKQREEETLKDKEKEDFARKKQEEINQYKTETRKNQALKAISAISNSADVIKSFTEKGRQYEIIQKETGSRYVLRIEQEDKKIKKAQYANNYSYFDKVPPKGFVEKDMKVLTVSCEEHKDGKIRFFSQRSQQPPESVKTPYSLEALFLKHLKLSGNINNSYETWYDSRLLRELLTIADDRIINAPHLLKQYRSSSAQNNQLEFIPAAENEEHLKRHTDSASLTIGSKALSDTSEQDVAAMLQKFDSTYRQMIEREGNPGRVVLGCKTDRWVGTDAVVPAEELKPGAVFKIIREPQTRGEAEIKVALINPADMPKTNVVHAVYGPYGSTGKGGIYTMIYGDPGESFPRKLPENASAQEIANNKKADAYWNGKDGKGGHVFLTTPQELSLALQKMEAAGLPTITQKTRLKKFMQEPQSPLIKHEPASISREAFNLGKMYLSVMGTANTQSGHMK